MRLKNKTNHKKYIQEEVIMKKIIVPVFSVLMMISLAACGNSSNQTEQSSAEKNSVESSVIDSVADTETDETESEETNAGEETEIPEQAETPEEDKSSRILVAYFSATNTTKGVAEHIANGLDADIYEIVPKELYTDADLDYNDKSSRSTIEMNDPDARPAISGSVENMDQYEIVFLGYPIWWGEAPRIVSTFVESYDFSGKTIVPFCTSGGSGIGSSATNLEQLTNGAKWLEGQRLNGGDSQDTVMEWVNELGLFK